ncbi:FAD-dependent oxidoreductase [Mesorhizobium sp. ORM6]
MNAVARQEVHGASLWHAISRGRRQRSPLHGEIGVDLAIVGGGFAGLSTALHAAGKSLSVAVLEAESIAWGATGRNAGFVVPNFAKMDPDSILAHLGPERGETDRFRGRQCRPGLRPYPAARHRLRRRAKRMDPAGAFARSLREGQIPFRTMGAARPAGRYFGWARRRGADGRSRLCRRLDGSFGWRAQSGRLRAGAGQRCGEGRRTYLRTGTRHLDRSQGRWLVAENAIGLGACRQGADRHQRLWRVAQSAAATNLFSAEGLPDRDQTPAA